MWVCTVQKPNNLRGRVMTEVVVPDFAKGPVSMSGLAVTAESANRVATARNDDRLAAVLGGPPAAARDFSSNDTIVIFTEIYDVRAGGGAVTSSGTVKKLDGETVHRGPLR